MTWWDADDADEDEPEFDESDVRVRPNRRGSRPRTKTRPEHADAVEGVVLGVDRGRYGVLIDEGGPDEREIIAARASELRRKSVVTGDHVDLDLSEAGELVPNLVALAAFADGPSTFTGIGHIRHHETDRLAALAAELNGLGGRVTELDDGLRIEPAPLHAGPWRAYADHRMATTGAIVGLAVPGVVVDDIASTGKTLPQFTKLWEQMLA